MNRISFCPDLNNMANIFLMSSCEKGKEKSCISIAVDQMFTSIAVVRAFLCLFGISGYLVNHYEYITIVST